MAVVDVKEGPPQDQKAVLLFWAPWHDASKPGGSMDQVLTALSDSTTEDVVFFGRVQAEECSDLTQKYSVTAVPTFVLLYASGQIFQRIEGDDVASVTQAVQRLIQTTESSPEPTPVHEPVLSPKEELNKRLDRLIRTSEVMLFMKGNPDAPRCGFSRQTVELLQAESIPFCSFDILSDETVRQGLKTYSNWPTYPQLYVNGSLVGGLDILKEMKEEGSLREQLGVTATTSTLAAAPTLDERLAELIRKEPIMLFMKGLPSSPRCGFSQQIVEILDEQDVAYGAFNILEDEEVRQGLKTFSNWPSYPQLYVNGTLIGGLDIVKEMNADGSLKEVLQGK